MRNSFSAMGNRVSHISALAIVLDFDIFHNINNLAKVVDFESFLIANLKDL